MSSDINGLVASSCNIGVMETLGDTIKISCMPRGVSNERAQHTAEQIAALANLCGAKLTLLQHGPAWPFNPESDVLKFFTSYHTQLYGDEPKVTAMHGGLECGIFADKLPDLDIVSFGPNMYDLHTQQERLSISSTEKTWVFLCGALGEMK